MLGSAKNSHRLGQAGIRIREIDGNIVWAEVQTDAGIVTVFAEMAIVSRTLRISGVHVEGEGLTLARIRELAIIFGQVEDVEEVVIQGGVRTSGAHPGSKPSPIRMKVT